MRIFSYLSQFMIFFFVEILVPFYSHLSSFKTNFPHFYNILFL